MNFIAIFPNLKGRNKEYLSQQLLYIFLLKIDLIVYIPHNRSQALTESAC